MTALDGAIGIKLALAEDPDVILLDMLMPDQDGFEVCRKMKSNARLNDIPIVFLTALRPDSASRIKALEAGADGFLAKPLEPAELVAQIRAMAKIKASHQFQRLQKEQLEALVAERTIELKHLLSVAGQMAQEWKTTFDSMDAAIWILDRDHRDDFSCARRCGDDRQFLSEQRILSPSHGLQLRSSQIRRGLKPSDQIGLNRGLLGLRIVSVC